MQTLVSRRSFIGQVALLASLSDRVWAAPSPGPDILSFSVPLDSTLHKCSFMQWPNKPALYGGNKGLHFMRQAVLRVAKLVRQFEPVVMLTGLETAESAYGKLGREFIIWPIATQDVWAQKTCPIFTVNPIRKQIVGLDFMAGEGETPPNLDAKISLQLCQKMNIPCVATQFTSGGGRVETDGEGTLLAPSTGFVGAHAQPLTPDEAAPLLLRCYGAQKIIWLPKSQAINFSQASQFVRFIKPGQLLVQLPEQNPHDAYAVLAYQVYAALQEATDALGRKFDIIPLNFPKPKPTLVTASPLGYLSFYVCNGGIIMPQFGDDRADQKALSLLQNLYAGRKVITLNYEETGEIGGAIRGLLQPLPVVT